MDFIFHKNDRLVVLSFINTSPKKNFSDSDERGILGNFEDDIDEFDYDPFETHDNLKTADATKSIKHEKPKQKSRTSEEEDVDDFDLEDDFDDEDESNESESGEDNRSLKTLNYDSEISTMTPSTTTTQRSVPTVKTSEPTVNKIYTTETTTNVITTEKATTEEYVTLPNEEITSLETSYGTEDHKSTTKNSIDDWYWSTPEKKALSSSSLTPSTSTTTLIPSTTPRASTTESSTLPTTALAATTMPTKVSSSANNKANKNHKTRKHHKKHQQNHHNENPEFRAEDFDDLHPEIEMKLGEKSNTSNHGKRKHKNSHGKQSQPERKGTTSDSSEKLSPTQKTKVSRGKQRNSDIINVKKETTNKNSSTSASIGDYSDFGTLKNIKRKKRSDVDEDVQDKKDEKTHDNLPDQAAPSVDEDRFILTDENGNSATSSAQTNENSSNKIEFDKINRFLVSVIGKTEKFDPKTIFSTSPTLEYINLAIALLVWSTRYPSVFWESSKAFTLIFSFQLIANSLDILVLYAGTGILFKVQTVGEFMTVNNHSSPLLLNGIVTLALTLLAFLLTISSSMILYLYGHSRLAAKIRDCKTISLKESDVWSYFSHCASLCFILAIAVVKAPIIHDLVVSYRISLDKKLLYASKLLKNL